MDKQIAKTQATIDNISIEEKPELFEIIKQYPNR
jgi:hypothetical protein